MGLAVPQVGIDPGPDYATNLYNCLYFTLDGHNHSPGNGVQINPAGLNINTDLTFQSNNATALRSVRFTPQNTTLPTTGADTACIYVSGIDLYYNDGAGDPAIQITKAGGVFATSSGISNGTSSAYFSAGQLLVYQNASTLTPGNIQVQSVLLGNNVSNGYYLTLSPPTLSSSQSITLPANPTSAGTYFVTMNNLGVQSANVTVDGTSVVLASNQISVNPSGIPAIANNYITHQWQLNGAYSSLTTPVSEIDGYCFFNFNATILAVWVYNVVAGSSGATTLDLLVGSTGGSFTSILSQTASISSAAAPGVWTDSNSVIGAQTGVTKPIVSTSAINAGQAIRMDVLSAMPGASDCGIILQFVPR